MPPFPEEIVVFDTEYTAWEGAEARGWNHPGEHREIVQIGALILETGAFSVRDTFLLYVRPKVNPRLSDFFVQFSGITQEKIDAEGVPYPEVLARFFAWSRGLSLYSWGNDLGVMAENAALVGIPFPFSQEDSDVRPYFAAGGIMTAGYHSSTIPRAFGEEPPAAHDALNDARSVAEALRALARSRTQ